MATQRTWGQKKLKKMMKLLCLLLALTSLVITAPSCKTSAMCQACDATTADKCTGCYNKGNDTTFNARALATNACANVITTAKVTGCKVYTSYRLLLEWCYMRTYSSCLSFINYVFGYFSIIELRIDLSNLKLYFTVLD